MGGKTGTGGEAEEDMVRSCLWYEPKPPSGKQADADLLVGAMGRNLPAIRAALAAGADPNARDSRGSVALMLSCGLSHESAVELLLPLTEPGLRDGESGAGGTAMHRAASSNCVFALRLLLKAGYGPMALDEMGRTPLMFAAMGSGTAALDELMPVSDLRAADGMGKTALMWACWMGNAEAAEKLLPGSDPRAVDSEGADALAAAIKTGVGGMKKAARRKICRLLMQVSDLGPGPGGISPAMEAARHGHPEILAELLEASPPEAIESPGGWNVLMFAAAGGREDCVRMALDRCDPSRRDPEGGLTAEEIARQVAHSGELADLIGNKSRAMAERGELGRGLSPGRPRRHGGGI